jgi:gliding motility-associated lipoprotein GldH
MIIKAKIIAESSDGIRKSNRIYLVILSVCFFLSCNDSTVYSKFQPISDKGWHQSEVFDFRFPISEKNVLYDLTVQLRNNELYPYQNIWLFSNTLKDDSIISADTIEYYLADDYGKWTGKGISLFQNRIPLYKNYQFPDTGNYTVKIKHGMRDNNLKGLEDIGLFVEISK